MIKISSPEQQLRQNRAMLLLIGGISSLGGLLIWSAPPFAINNPKNPVHVSLRYIALVSGLVCGVSAVACGHQLQKIAPLIEAMDAAEKRDFLTQLAVACHVQETQHKAAAMQTLSPASETPLASHPEPESVNADADLQPASELPLTTSTPGSPDVEGFRPLWKSVSLAKAQGATDTQIIEDVLEMKGRKFNQGKAALQALLQLGKEQGW